MKKFSIEHNPFFNDTKIWIGDQLTNDEKFSRLKNNRLINIVDDIPKTFFEDCNDSGINIHFIGRTFEYEDLLHSCNIYNKNNQTNITVEHTIKYDNIDITKLKEFEAILRESPIKELSENEELINRFLNKLTTEFEVAVVATMSSGKSTLINSMIGQSILPARNEATTAKIFSIRDDDDAKEFSLELLDKEKNGLESKDGSLQEQLEDANSREDVHEIRLHGDLPNISSSTANLVLLDTPGPNNAQNQEHKETTYRLIKDNEKNPLIVYVLNAQQLTTDGVNNLLEEISDTIKSKNSSQNHDRFIFVLNKADGLEEEEVSKMIDDAKKFLEKFSIKDPKVFPISSFSGLCCRKDAKKLKLSRKEKNQLNDSMSIVEDKVATHFFEQYAPLSEHQKSIIQNKLNKAKENDDWLTQAEIHSGIPSLEMAIDDYVNKYAIPMKIHDAFAEIEKAVDKEVNKDELLKVLQEREHESKDLDEKLQEASRKITSKESVDRFKKKIESIGISYEPIDNEKEKLEKKFNEILKKDIFKQDTEIEKAKRELGAVYKTISDLETSIKTTLESQIHADIKGKSDEIISEFKDEISKTFEDIDLGEIAYNVKTFSSSMIPSKDMILQKSSKSVREKDRLVIEYRTFFGMFDLWEKERYWKYKDVEKSDHKKLDDEFLKLKTSFRNEIGKEIDKAEVSLKHIKTVAIQEIETVREAIANEMSKMGELTKNKENLEIEINAHQNILSWIDAYNSKKENFIN